MPMSELSEAAIPAPANRARCARGTRRNIDVIPQATNANLYTDTNPLGEFDFAAKVKLLEDMNDYARSLDDSVTFSASISGEWQYVQVVRADREPPRRHPPSCPRQRIHSLFRWRPHEAGSHGTGGRTGYGVYRTGCLAGRSTAFRQAR